VAFGEKVVMRIFDPETFAMELPQLGFYPDEMEVFGDFISRPHGIILVTGPTGSGKTTTLYSAMRTIATREINITTIEDPIEIVCEEFNQIAVQTKIGITFAEALRYVLRQDPTSSWSARSATRRRRSTRSGRAHRHLVFSTLHTNDRRDLDLASDRPRGRAVPDQLDAGGHMAQRLVRRICARCSTVRYLSRERCRRCASRCRQARRCR
jgi:general secretion pathway protein E